MRALVLAANQDPALTRVFSTFAAVSAAMGGAYVNGFTLFGRTWKMSLQAEQADRAGIADI